jgi:aryl-alcohol dehydrogenase-like predicted oxidoreductase
MLDTAEVYGGGAGGTNERLLGRAIADRRDEAVLATKFGFDMSDPTHEARDSRPENIRNVAERSLLNLGTDHLDVLYQHRVDPDLPIEEVAGAVKSLIDEGTIRFFGLSEAGPQTIRRAHAVQPVSVVESEYSIFERSIENQVLPVLRELGIGLVAYAPLGRGFLTGELKPGPEYGPDDYRRIDPRWHGEDYERNAAAVRELSAFARDKNITAAQLALAWLLAQGEDIVPIPGTRSEHRLAENIAAATVALDAADLERIHTILPGGASGARYPASMMPVSE